MIKCSVCGREYTDEQAEVEIQFTTADHSLTVCRSCGEKMLKKLYERRALLDPNSKAEFEEEMENEKQKTTEDDLQELLEMVARETPSKIKAHLDQYVIDQEEAKRILSVAVYNHYKRLAFQAKIDMRKKMGKPLSDKIPTKIQKSNIIMVGPSGSGKTYILKSIAEYLGVPFAVTDSSSLTKSGFVGNDPETCVRNLYEASGRDVKKTERGIIFLDEFDKLARKSGENRSITADPGNEGVQQELLKIIEGGEIHISMANRKHPDAPTVKIDTSNILFICGGAFEGIDKIVESRIEGANGFGLTRKDVNGLDEKKDPIDRQNSILDLLEVEDFKKYGLMAEIMGRLPIICKLHQLKEEDLIRILSEPKDAILKQYSVLFGMDHCGLHFDQDALHEIAATAIKAGTGARALRTIVEGILLDTMYDLPEIAEKADHGLRAQVHVTKESVSTKKPEIEYVPKTSA